MKTQYTVTLMDGMKVITVLTVTLRKSRAKRAQMKAARKYGLDAVKITTQQVIV